MYYALLKLSSREYTEKREPWGIDEYHGTACCLYDVITLVILVAPPLPFIIILKVCNMQSIRNRYRTSDIHDVMETVRNPNCEFDPEPSTLPAVCDFELFVTFSGVYEDLQRSW